MGGAGFRSCACPQQGHSTRRSLGAYTGRLPPRPPLRPLGRRANPEDRFSRLASGHRWRRREPRARVSIGGSPCGHMAERRTRRAACSGRGQKEPLQNPAALQRWLRGGRRFAYARIGAAASPPRPRGGARRPPVKAIGWEGGEETHWAPQGGRAAHASHALHVR